MPGWDVPGYTGLKVLGSGGFADVVLARHDASGTRVAIKYLRRTLLADQEFTELFRSEAAVLASLDDQNVVRLYEYVESPSGAAIVMELIDGVSLREILTHQGKTTAEAALMVLEGSLLGLAAAHRHGVVHRDYKPENVLVNGDGVSKLTDFGIAARSGDRPIAAGTLAYAPPEQFGGGPASPSGDVYAATATFYECLTGRPPFSGDSAERLMWQHMAEPVPLEPVPEPLRPLVEAGMAKEPQRRPANAAALVTELKKIASWTYGPGWAERGRSHLGEAALLLAALWPSAGPPAVHGSTVHRISLHRHLPQRPVSTVKAAIAVGAAAAVAAVVVAVLPRSKPPAPAPTPTVSGALTAVTATSDSSAWAVGCTPGTPASKCTKTLMLRWNGTAWTQVPSPSPGPSDYLSAVAATSAGSAWAVGYTGSGASARTLILHWNGATWTRVPSPNTGQDSILTGMAAVSAGSAWAIGYTDTSSPGSLNALLLRWNGTAWTRVPSPAPAGTLLSGVAATSAGTAWAVGTAAPPGCHVITCAQTVILRWNGTAWTRVPSPAPAGSGLESIATLPGNNALVVGGRGGKTLILRWNGEAWN
jgi:serine/threonine-protein kinase